MLNDTLFPLGVDISCPSTVGITLGEYVPSGIRVPIWLETIVANENKKSLSEAKHTKMVSKSSRVHTSVSFGWLIAQK